MIREDILRMAREADIIDFRDDDSDPHVKQMIDFFEVVIERAVAAEREDIAKHFERHPWMEYFGHQIAENIRARNES